MEDKGFLVALGLRPTAGMCDVDGAGVTDLLTVPALRGPRP